MRKFLLGGIMTAIMLLPGLANAGTTGNITGTVTDASGKPVAGARVTAASLSQSESGTTDQSGFYSLVNMLPDTYTVSFQKEGFASATVSGVTVQQDQTARVNETLRSEALQTIANVTSQGTSNLVKPNVTSDVYTVGGAQLTAATNPVGALETIYQYLAVTPGVTANGFPAQPRIRGGQVTDLGYEFEGIPIQDRMVGYFTTNLSNTGLSNIEVYTGGLSGAGAINGTGYFNSVLKVGTYPGFTTLSAQVSSPEQNQYLTFEHGWATPDHRWSYYVGFTGVNSQNQYDYGEVTYPGVLFCCDGPGPVKERNWVGNVHFHPDARNDFQFVLTNDWGNFDFNYLLQRSPGQPLALGLAACPGATSSWPTFPNGSPSTGTYGQGGTAPNGQPCPLGLYWRALPNGGGNVWNHYGGLGKLQWNHNFNTHSSIQLRADENFNQYIFDQPISDPNIPSLENPGGPFSWFGNSCPLYPYTAGTPVAAPAGDPYDMCSWFDGLQTFYGDRRSNIYNFGADYTNVMSDRVTFRAGVSHEYDRNVFDYYATDVFTALPGGGLKYPAIYQDSTFPTTQQVAYVNADLRFGKLLITPGLTYAQRHYAFPADYGFVGTTGGTSAATITKGNIYSGGYTAHIYDPTFAGTYLFDPNNDIKFSFGNTSSFVGSEYVWASSLALGTGFDSGHTPRDPFAPGVSFKPQINHAAELLWEHNFGNGTSIRFGPYYNSTSNYYSTYQPFLGYFVTPCDQNNLSSCTPCQVGQAGCVPTFSKSSVLTNNNRHKTFGLEFGLNHINNGMRGTSYWLSGTYDNFWTSAYDISGAFINSSLPNNIVNQGTLVRSGSNPLWSATLVADYHSDRFHMDPLIYYQGDTFFNTGDIHSCYPASVPDYNCGGSSAPGSIPVAPYFASNRQIAHGWWRANLTLYELLGEKRNVVIGFKADNLFNQVADTAPCPNDGNGCYPFDLKTSLGPASSYPNIHWIYPNYSQSPRTFYFFAGLKM